MARSPLRDLFPPDAAPPPGTLKFDPYIWGPLPYLRELRDTWSAKRARRCALRDRRTVTGR